MISKSKPEGAKGAEEHAAQWRSWLDELTEKIIGAAIEVHRQLGPGLMEPVYEECLCYELKPLGLWFQRQTQLPVLYKGIRLDAGCKMDLVVADAVVLELKTVDRLLPVDSAQLLTYLKLSGKSVGLLMNFNEPVLRKGLKRLVNHYSESASASHSSAPSARETGEEEQTRTEVNSREARRLGASAVK